MRLKWIVGLSMFIFFVSVSARAASSPGGIRKAREILDISFEKGTDFIYFTILADGKLGGYNSFQLSSAPGLVVDLPGVKPRFSKKRFQFENPLVKEVKIILHQDKSSLVFYSIKAPLPPYEIKSGKNGLIISFGFQRGARAQTGAEGRREVVRPDPSVRGDRKEAVESTPPAKEVETPPKTAAPAQPAPKIAVEEVRKEKEEVPPISESKAIPSAAPMQPPDRITFGEVKPSLGTQGPDELLTLEESIKIALERNLQLHSAMEGVVGSQYRQKEAITNFLPLWTGQYSFTRYNAPSTIGFSGGTGSTSTTSRDIYNFNTTANQPLFTGGANLANYRTQKLGVDISKASVETVRMDIVLQVRQGYYNILTSLKLRDVAEQTVKQFVAQLEVSKAFFEVGIVAKNDVLQAEVRLAQARQNLVKAENGVALAKASFNNLLRREINTPLSLVDILRYQQFTVLFEEGIEEALRRRPEIRAAELTIDQAKEGVKIARSGFFPTISLLGNYFRVSDLYTLDGNKNTERWTLQTLATFTLWNWGNTAFKVGENKVKVTQAEDSKIQLVEGIVLEVKQNYLNVLQSEKNISLAEKAIEQAEENLRMNEERYKYQVATATELLDAVTFLEQARVNYYSALSDFNIAKAQLERAMGRVYP